MPPIMPFGYLCGDGFIIIFFLGKHIFENDALCTISQLFFGN